jgi:L-2-hydroxyglutarate oxidase LhgO
MTMERLDCAVIGAGVVGLAIARRLARGGRAVVVLEAEKAIGTHTSSRNSEVIHAGIYYAPGSEKARLCVDGKRLLYRYCEDRGVAHRRIGKLIVAVREQELPVLEKYRAQAFANGVDDLVWVDRDAVRELEPDVSCVRALLSPSTGILDSHGLMRALAADATDHGADLALMSPVVGGEVGADGIVLTIGGAEQSSFRFRAVVNSAGLFAQTVARSFSGLAPATIPGQYFAKGHYFVMTGRVPFQRLVYPVPVKGGLGTHVTLDLAGRARFGPDVCWTDRVEYGFDESRAPSFYDAIRTYYPGLHDGTLEPGFVGIRPKLSGDGAAHDFMIQTDREHGVPGLVNLYGIESPGLTSCLAIAEHVARTLGT